MGWKKLEAARPGRPTEIGSAIVIYPGTSTMYASGVLRSVASNVVFEINEDAQLLRVTPAVEGINISYGRFNFRPLRQLFRGITENTVISLTEQDGKYVGSLIQEKV
ncbi:hypothetical protein BKM35_22040 [Salmonella enterica]|nr:hypothetical protein [Salmonella enterica]